MLNKTLNIFFFFLKKSGRTQTSFKTLNFDHLQKGSNVTPVEPCSRRTNRHAVSLTGSMPPRGKGASLEKHVSSTGGRNRQLNMVRKVDNTTQTEGGLTGWCLYTGSYRECFPTSYKLGIQNQPVRVTKTCELQRTQRDPRSTIRACLCTSDRCNIVPSEVFGNDKSNEVMEKESTRTNIGTIKFQLFTIKKFWLAAKDETLWWKITTWDKHKLHTHTHTDWLD